MAASDVLATAGEIGPFFAVTTGAGGPPWVPFTELGTAAGRELLTERMGAMAGMLGVDASELQRPLASMLHLGAAAACVGPVLACAAQSGVVPRLSPDVVAISYAGGRLALGLTPGADDVVELTSGPLPLLAEAVRQVALDLLLGPFTAALTAVVALPETITAGNAYSALAAAARLITPPAAGRRARLMVDLIGRQRLAEAGDLHWQDDDPSTYFRRRNCCLFYKIPGAGYCGDCILAPAP